MFFGKKGIAGKIVSDVMTSKQYTKGTAILYVVLRVLVFLSLILAILGKRWQNAFLCVLVLILLELPTMVERKLKIELPTALDCIVLLFIFCAEILGETQEYFVKYPYWDTLLHTTNGFLCAALGFALVDVLNRNSKFKFQLSPLYLAIVAFCFSMTIGVLWEFFEFGMDYFFNMDMQKDTILTTFSSVTLDPDGGNTPYVVKDIYDASINGQSLGLGGYLDIGLYDTMADMFVNFIGAVVFSVIGFFYVKNRGRGKVAKQFIPTLRESEEPTAANDDGIKTP